TTKRSNGCGGRKGCGCRSTGAANVWAPPPHPIPPPRMRRTRCGRWTSSSTPPPTADRSRSSPLSTSTPVNASVGWSSAPSPPTNSSTNLTGSPTSAAIRRCCAATTAPSWPALRWPSGPTNESGSGSSHPGSRGATAISSPSTADSATNASTSTSSGPWPTPESSSATGKPSTTTTAGTQPSAINHPLYTLRPAPTNEPELSQSPDQFTGSCQHDSGQRQAWSRYLATLRSPDRGSALGQGSRLGEPLRNGCHKQNYG